MVDTKVGRFEDQAEAVEGIAADFPVKPGGLEVMAFEVAARGHGGLLALEQDDRRDRDREPASGNRQQGVAAHVVHQDGREPRPRYRPQAAACSDEAEDPLRLLAREEIRHEAPEHRDDEQVEDAGPAVEDARERPVLRQPLEQDVEDQNVDHEEAVGPRQ
jgi:hypothetical protein